MQHTFGRMLVSLGCLLAASIAARADVMTYVPEAAGYQLVYTYDIPTSAALNNTNIAYAFNNSAAIPRGSFDRIAYYMELQPTSGPLQYVYASMDAFTDDVRRIGIPNRSGSFFQRPVASMNVVSNVAGVVTGTALAGGNIEFWSTNYAAPNTAAVSGASGTTFDFGDQPTAGGYGSMQVHNSAAAQTLFSYSRWGGTSVGTSDLGIGNSSTGNPDYTFRANATDYTVRKLQVLVRSGPAPTPKISIMTLGDSITDGAGTPGAYRTRLQERLTTAGTNFEFVGSQVNNASTALATAGRVSHEGHSGYRIDQLHDNLDGLASTGSTNNGGYWLNNTVWPDYILVHIGTNDFGQNYNITTAKDRLDALITKLTAMRPGAHVIVSNLLKRTNNPTANTNLETMFNPYVEGIVNNHRANGEKVYFLDLYSLLDPATHMYDGLHPNAAGDTIMGDAFYGAMIAVPEPAGVLWITGAALLLIRRRR